MKKDWKYMMYIGLLAGLLVVLMLSKSKEYDWRITFSHLDKNPYGAYALNQLLKDNFNNPVKNSFKTVYELKDSLSSTENLLIISSSFSPGKADTEMLLNYVEQGGSVFISANNFYGIFADTLGIQTSDSFFESENTFVLSDSAFLHFVSPVIDTLRQYKFRKGNIHNYISDVDSLPATVLAKNDFHQPVTIRIEKGKGVLIINCTPMAFTNIHLLDGQNHEFAAASLSYLPNKNTYWTEFYHLGRMEAATPLRFILQNEPLRWAYYIAIISLLLFMAFEAKRKQRIIPIIKPLENTTLEFVATIGNLYYQRADHKNIALKKIQFFFDYIHSHYGLNTQHRDEGFISILTRKSGVSESIVRGLINTINEVVAKEKITATELTQLNLEMENFQQKK
jgi:hypothetical protein